MPPAVAPISAGLKGAPTLRDWGGILATVFGILDPLVAGDTSLAAIELLATVVRREALVLTFNDVIMLLGTLFVVGLMLMPLVSRPRGGRRCPAVIAGCGPNPPVARRRRLETAEPPDDVSTAEVIDELSDPDAGSSDLASGR